MRDVAVVSFAQSPCLAANRRDDMADILLPVLREALQTAGVERSEVDFWSSGSHDFYEGRTFAYIESLDAVGAWPPISESHVEMDAAWAFHEAWAWLQIGQGEIAVVFGVGRGSLSSNLDQVMPAQLDPYYLAPLRPHRDALAALQARAVLESGLATERQLAEVVARSLGDAAANPNAQVSGRPDIEELLAAPYIASPLRSHDAAPVGDAAAAVVLAAGDTARRLSERPAWVRAVDHRMDTHYPGFRDLVGVPSARTAGERAGAQAGFAPSAVDVAELSVQYSHQEPVLRAALGLGEVKVNPSGGPLAGYPVTATGLIRVGEAARRIHAGDAERALAHAASGPALQQNLVCLMEATS